MLNLSPLFSIAKAVRNFPTPYLSPVHTGDYSRQCRRQCRQGFTMYVMDIDR